MHLEVTSVLAMKPGDFTPASLTVLKNIMEAHCGPQNMPKIDAMEKLQSHKAEIEEQEFELIMKQLGYDVDAWRVHMKTVSDYAAAVHKQKRAWNLRRHEQSGKAPEAFLKQHCRVLKFDQASNMPVLDFMAWKKELSATLQIPEERGHTFSCLNLAAPSLSPSFDMEFFGSCALMAVIMPQFSYKRGPIYILSRMVKDIFVSRGLAIDSQWAPTVP